MPNGYGHDAPIEPRTPGGFVGRWALASASEQANSQSFLKELCGLIGVDHPDVTTGDDAKDGYVFEKPVCFNNGDGSTSRGRIDLYRRNCFVLESKQGSERKSAEAAEALATKNRGKQKQRPPFAERGTDAWDQAMAKAREQAKRYAEALPEWPPFLIVVDIGHCFDLYADFSQSGKHYVPFPDPQNYRIPLAHLTKEDVRDQLRTIWEDPYSLNPALRSAKVTRELASRLAKLAKSLEHQADASGQPCYTPERVAHFLMRCLFTMFAEDVGLLDKDSFKSLLQDLRSDVATFAPTIGELWRTMNTGGVSPVLRKTLRKFNGGLFSDCEALPLTQDQLDLLIEASAAHWTDVEPAIFGTLLERALDPVERHKLGAHFTPRAYVERLVLPTIIEPLRAEWDTAYATAARLYKTGKVEDAQKVIADFHGHLCEIHVLDPACGSGNFLYVALELMKRLEGEVLKALRDFGDRQLRLAEATTVNPEQLLGIDINARAVAIADLVLWIGYFQWHFRTVGRVAPQEPILRNYNNIQCRDAVLAWDTVESVFDDDGKPVTRWDGRTTKTHPVTGEEVPDETARVQELRYVNPRKAEWPKADYIVGNPPFIGVRRLRLALGDGYVDSLRVAFEELPETLDYVMYWWHKAGGLLGNASIRRFGFITTNSITHSSNRIVLEAHLSGKEQISIAFAIPDHPWVDSADGAKVRIAMTVAAPEHCHGRLLAVTQETVSDDGEHKVEFSERTGVIHQNLRVGTNITDVSPLISNCGLCFMGVTLIGDFRITAGDLLNFGLDVNALPPVVRPYLNAKDVAQLPENRFVIDFFGLSENEARTKYPALYQWILHRVKPLREQNKREAYKRNWWIFGEPRPAMRAALASLRRFIAVPETSKFKPFVFLDASVTPDHKLYAVATDDAWGLAVLSSRVHTCWALAAGGRLEDRPTWTNGTCFLPFPFPEANVEKQERIRDLGEQLDAHRKRQQSQHPELTMTGMYNVLEKLRSGEQLTKKEQQIHEQGLVSVLRQIHDDLDAAVFDAYGWPHDLSDEAILERLVALNHERAEEEKRGLVRWLRPDYQKPLFAQPALQQELDMGETPVEPAKPKAAAKQPWPKNTRDQVREVREVLVRFGIPALPADVAKCFTRATKAAVAEILDTLADVGQVRQTEDGRYVP